MSFLIKPSDQTDETESPNLDNKTELKGVPKLFFHSVRCSEKFQMEGLLTDLQQQEIKELLAGSFNFSTEVLPSLKT